MSAAAPSDNASAASREELLFALEPPPQHGAGEPPRRFPSPFDASAPSPLALQAAAQLRARLQTQPALDEGKMFAALVVARADGTLAVLHGFSGMLRGRWELPGFVPPMFSVAAREPWWTEAQARLAGWDDELRELANGEASTRLRAAWARRMREQEEAAEELRRRHRERRAERHRLRRTLRDRAPSAERAAATHALDQESRGDTAEQRKLEAAHRAERAPQEAVLAELQERQRALARLRAESSARFQQRLHDLYEVPSWSGETRPLRELFAPGEPPSGAGDCAGPKLLACAIRAGLRPVALVELWWGPPPLGGGRHHGQIYPACRGKCGPLLPHMLGGLDVEAAPSFGGAAARRSAMSDDEESSSEEPQEIHNLESASGAPPTHSARRRGLARGAWSDLQIAYEDEWLLALVKPCGLLSVPGRSADLEDSVLSRLRRRFPQATGPLLVHRLDLDTSGLLLAAKDSATHAALQRLFVHRAAEGEAGGDARSERRLEKRYVAILEGAVAGERGVIELALRTDLDDRPRQMHDPVHGRPALTQWQVLQRQESKTRVALVPRTGRTHQLRVHAAHPLGLAAPILGDRLYGQGSPASRLMLHAERLAFAHPRTGERLELSSEAPF